MFTSSFRPTIWTKTKTRGYATEELLPAVATKGEAGSRLGLQTAEVHQDLDEDGVVPYVGVFTVQLGQGTEERTPAGDVHVADRPLKGRGGDVGPEGVDDVLPVVLVEQHEGHLSTQVKGGASHLRWSNTATLSTSLERALPSG